MIFENGKKMTLKIRLFLNIVFLTISFHSYAQFYNGSHITFGKNRVQHQYREWIYIKQNNFDVYFYTQGRSLAQYTAYVASDYILEIEQKLNCSLSQKLQFFIYENYADFKESNFNYDNEFFYNTGGIANVYGPKVFLYFEGSHLKFNHLIKNGIAHVYANAILQGQTARSNYSASSLLNLPEWFLSGLTAYLSGSMDSYALSYIKDGIQTRRFLKPDGLKYEEALYFGLSFWKFVDEKYGKTAISAILYATKSSKNYQRALRYAIGKSYQEVMADWYRYYMTYFNHLSKTEIPQQSVLNKTKRHIKYQQFKLNPIHEGFAYTTNENGQIKIWIKTPNDKKPKKIYRKNYKLDDKPDYSFPLLNWTPDGNDLSYIIEKKGKVYLYLTNAETKKTYTNYWVNLKKITDYCFSGDGKTMLLSGISNGQSDIYQYFFRTQTLMPITSDFYDDASPIYIDEDFSKIIFSSNRPHETLTNEKSFETKFNKTYDLFFYDLKQKDKPLTRLTYTQNASETKLQQIQPKLFTYLTNQNGIYNRFIASLDSNILRIDTAIHYGYFAKSAPLSDYPISILEQNIVNDRIAEIIYYNSRYNLIVSPLNINQKIHLTPPVNFNITTSKEDKKTKEECDSVPKFRTFVQIRMSQILSKDSLQSHLDISQKNSEIETDDPETHFQTRNYHIEYNLNKLVAQADLNYLNTSYQSFSGGSSPIYLNSGISGLLMVGIQDLFEDYRYTGGLNFSLNFKNFEALISYENLKKRLDRQIVFDYKIQRNEDNYSVTKLHALTAYYILKYPFDVANSLRLSFIGRYDRIITGSLSDYSLKTEDRNTVRLGLKLEYIFDNIRYLDVNLYKGWRAKFFGEYYQTAAKNTKNMFVIGFDVRQYLHLWKNMIWANRIAGSTSLGQEKLVYYMGGVDSWLFPKFNTDTWVDTTINYVYQTLATNMRGFTQNIRNGNSFILLSSEFRIPFVQMIAQRPINNSILRSLQAVIFGDFGTAWTGLTPYSENNSLYLKYITSGPMNIMLRRNVNPFVGGFGIGLRAELFGYIMRLDYAWGIEDGNIDKKGVFYFSLGLDF